MWSGMNLRPIDVHALLRALSTERLRRPQMKLVTIAMSGCLLLAVPGAASAQESRPLPRVVDLRIDKAVD